MEYCPTRDSFRRNVVPTGTPIGGMLIRRISSGGVLGCKSIPVLHYSIAPSIHIYIEPFIILNGYEALESMFKYNPVLASVLGKGGENAKWYNF